MMTRYRMRLGSEILQEVNDVIIGRKTVEDVRSKIEDRDDSNGHDDHSDDHDGARGQGQWESRARRKRTAAH